MSTYCTCGAGHATFGACMRAKNIRISNCQEWKGRDSSREKRWDNELKAYADAKRQGVQPEGTSTAQIRAALDTSDREGRPFNAETRGSDLVAASG